MFSVSENKQNYLNWSSFLQLFISTSNFWQRLSISTIAGWVGPGTPSESWYTFGPQRVTHRSTLVIHRVLTGSISRVNLNAGMDISRTEGTRVRVGAPLKSIT